ncbi:unnamed protein product [Lactuca virosa]|uniref:DUF676 domain-containing protein n=1 Tax=Lactuca virosa TaxID=75947 RepID=A0AAU9N969_9ASTR|nr:unnamed protein product [Lactuca virosa]
MMNDLKLYEKSHFPTQHEKSQGKQNTYFAPTVTSGAEKNLLRSTATSGAAGGVAGAFGAVDRKLYVGNLHFNMTELQLKQSQVGGKLLIFQSTIPSLGVGRLRLRGDDLRYFATPYLGSRGHRQVPMFFGVKSLEKIGYHSSVVVRRTGRHLYLKDKANGHTPLLVQMANDSEHLKFILLFSNLIIVEEKNNKYSRIWNILAHRFKKQKQQQRKLNG